MSLKNETKTFYKEYIAGMSSEKLGRDLQSDSQRLKELYQQAIKEKHPQQDPENISFGGRLLSLLSALTNRLSPVRRLVFGIALLSFFFYFILGLLGINQPLLLPLSFLAMLALLCIELLEKSDAQKELNLARDIQRSLLPSSTFSKGDLETFSFAATAQQVGGDYVDVIESEKGVYVVIADVSGKGLQAALYMVRFQALVKLLLNKHTMSPKELLLELNDYVKSNKSDRTFITASVAFFPHDGEQMIYARAGQNQPVHYRHSSERTTTYKTPGLGLGMCPTGMLKENLEEITVDFHSGDSILFYTDGLTEARNRAGEEFGLHRLDGILSIYGSLHAKSVVLKIQNQIEAFIGEMDPLDDITFTVVHRNQPIKREHD
ncbi:MAG: PP2C family protein-serine/threonine phosphatase [Balneolaceae bacterium]